MKKRRTILRWAVFLLVTIVSFFSVSSEASAATDDMYRLYNPNSGEHFYTKNGAERDMLKQVGWKDEGVGWYAPTTGDPVYRLYNPNAGDHHYTLNGNEKDMLVGIGWRYEGVGWFSDTNKTIKLYRAYNPNAVAGSHNYTVNGAEQDMLIKAGWHDEGTAWYGTHRGSGDKKPAATVKKTDLQNLYNKYKGTAKGTYTTATWNTFQSALKSAKSTIDNKKATQKQVDDAKNALQKAYNGLKKESKPAPSVSKKDLQTLYDKYKGTAKGSYTTATWDKFQAALKSAKSVLDNGKATQAQVNNAKTTLQSSYDGLKKADPEVQSHTITIKYVDTENQEIQKATTVKVKHGEDYTADALEIEGYVLKGEKSRTLSNITSKQEIVFTYEKKGAGDDKEKVAFSGHAYNSLKQVLKNKEIVVSSDNYESETITTEEDGYFFTHLILNETYTLNGEDFEITVTAKSLDEVEVINVKGEIITGKYLSDPEVGDLNLDQSVVYVDNGDYTITPDSNKVEIPADEEILTGDIVVLPPSDTHIEGYSFKVTSVNHVDGKTELITEPCRIDEIVEEVNFSGEFDISEMTFIPAEGVTPEVSRASRADGGFNQKYNKQINLGQGKGNIGIEFSGSITPIWEYNKFNPFDSKVGIAPNITTKITADFNLKGKASTTVPIGNFIVQTPIGISVSVDVSFYISAEGEVEVKYSLTNTQAAEAGVKDMQIYHEMKPSKSTEKFSVDGALSFEAAPQLGVGFGVGGLDAVKLNAQGGVDAGVTANYQNDRNRIHFTGKANMYVYAGFSMPIFSILPNDWSDEREIIQQKFPFTDDIDFELPIDPNKPITGGGETPDPGVDPENPGGEDPGEEGANWMALTADNFPDRYFRDEIASSYHSGASLYIEPVYDAEGNYIHDRVDTNKLNSLGFTNSLTSSVAGIENFKYLKDFGIRGSMNIKHLDLSKNKRMSQVTLDTTSIESINLKDLDQLGYLSIASSPINSIDVSSNRNLIRLEIYNTNIKVLDASNLPFLENLHCPENQLEQVNTEGSTNIQYLSLDSNMLTELSINHLANLLHVSASNNKLTSIDLSDSLVLVLDTFDYTNFCDNQITDVYWPRNFSSGFDPQRIINSTFRNNSETLITHYVDRTRSYSRDEYGFYQLLEW